MDLWINGWMDGFWGGLVNRSVDIQLVELMLGAVRFKLNLNHTSTYNFINIFC